METTQYTFTAQWHMNDNKNIIPKGHLIKSTLYERSNLKNKGTSLDYFQNSIKSLCREIKITPFLDMNITYKTVSHDHVSFNI